MLVFVKLKKRNLVSKLWLFKTSQQGPCPQHESLQPPQRSCSPQRKVKTQTLFSPQGPGRSNISKKWVLIMLQRKLLYDPTFPKDSGESAQKRGFKDLNVWPLYTDTCAESSKAPLLGACPQPQGQPQVESRLFGLQLPVNCFFFSNLCLLITNLLLVGFLSPTAGSTSS